MLTAKVPQQNSWREHFHISWSTGTYQLIAGRSRHDNNNLVEARPRVRTLDILDNNELTLKWNRVSRLKGTTNSGIHHS